MSETCPCLVEYVRLVIQGVLLGCATTSFYRRMQCSLELLFFVRLYSFQGLECHSLKTNPSLILQQWTEQRVHNSVLIRVWWRLYLSFSIIVKGQNIAFTVIIIFKCQNQRSWIINWQYHILYLPSSTFKQNINMSASQSMYLFKLYTVWTPRVYDISKVINRLLNSFGNARI